MPNHQKSPKLRPSRHRKFPKLRRGGVTPHEVRRQHQSLAFAYGLRPAPARPRICPPAPGILVDRVEGQRAHAPLAGAQLPDRLPTRPALPGRAKFRRQQEPPSRRSTCQLGDREAGSPGRRTGRSARSAPRRARRSPRRVIGVRHALARLTTMCDRSLRVITSPWGVQAGFHGGSSRFRGQSGLILAPESLRTISCPRQRATFLHVREHTARPSAGDQHRRCST